MSYCSCINKEKLQSNSYIECEREEECSGRIDLSIRVWYDDGSCDYETLFHTDNVCYPELDVDKTWKEMKAEAEDIASYYGLELKVY